MGTHTVTLWLTQPSGMAFGAGTMVTGWGGLATGVFLHPEWGWVLSPQPAHAMGLQTSPPAQLHQEGLCGGFGDRLGTHRPS